MAIIFYIDVANIHNNINNTNQQYYLKTVKI